MRIVGISDLVCDIYYDEKLNIIGAFGGISACNIICNLQFMGFDTFIYGVCGNDYQGKICIDSLNDCNVKNDILVLDNITTKTYQILKRKDNNRDVFRSIKSCPFCNKSTWYEGSYIDEKGILKKIKNDDILLFDNLNNKNQYIIDNTNNIKLLDLGTFNEFDNLNKKEIIKKIAGKFTIINLNERVEKYLINTLNCKNTLDLASLINSDLLIVTRGIRGNDFVYQNNIYSFPLTEIVDEVDDSGAGDAFFSIIIKNWLENKLVIDAQLFSIWVNDTKPLVKKVLKMIGSRTFIYPMYQVDRRKLCFSYDYKIYIPSGNPTALVTKMIKDINIRKKINDEIMQKYDFVEQVGFISEKEPELLMAGGEFCGNATRSAINYYLKGKEGNIKIKVSGVRRQIIGGIDALGNTWVDMPIIKGDYQKSIQVINEEMMIIKMNGITHVVFETSDIDKYNNEELIEYAKSILKKENLLRRKAAGVIFIKPINEKNIQIYPVVYVSKIKTLFYETACGSGSTAVGIYMCYKKKKSIDINIIQPSGDIIKVKATGNEKNISSIIISGKVKEYNEGE